MSENKKSCRPALAGIALTILASFLVVPDALAQLTTGNLTGTVHDSSEAVVASAKVVAQRTGTGVEFTAISDARGIYRFNNLPVGDYDLVVTAPGFSAETLKAISVDLNVTVTANATLQVGTSTTVVNVEAAAAIDTSSAQIASTFTAAQSADLPTATYGSGVWNLSLLSPGVATAGAVGSGFGPSVGGQRPRYNNFTVEGVDNNAKNISVALVRVPNDALAEFTVLQNQFAPDFGHSMGGQFNQVVKSGSNSYHGSLYEYMETRNFDAADNLDAIGGNPLHPRFDNNRFGGTFGGPILKNKLFFFTNYEYNPVGLTADTYYFAPTQAGYNTLAAMPGINQTNLSELRKYLGAASTPVSDSATPFQGPVMVGPGNESQGEQSSSAVAIPVGRISQSLPDYFNNTSAVSSIDYTLSGKDQMRGRFVLNRSGFVDCTGFPAPFFTTRPVNDYLVAISEYRSFTPTLVNELRLGYNRFNNSNPIPNPSFPGLSQFPTITINELQAHFGPDLNAPEFSIQNTYQLNDNVTWTRGEHTLKFGFDGYKWIEPWQFTPYLRGNYQWSGLSDYLFDYYPDYIATRSIGNPVYYGDQVLLGFHGNDTWRINPHLTANVGLRYEFETVPYTERLQTLNAVSNVPGLITFGEPQPQKNAFMPRVGLAYSPGNSGNTSIRAGFGIGYDVLADNFGQLTLPPQFSSTFSAAGIDQAGFLANGGITGGPVRAPDNFRPVTSGFIPDQIRPEALEWNLGVQHVFSGDYTVEVRYLGSRGIHLTVQDQVNTKPVVNSSNALPVYFSRPSQAVLDSLGNTLSALSNAFNYGGYLVPAFLDAGFYTPITAYQPWGNSTYHGMAAQVTRRFSRGLQFIGAYTWSHNIDDSTADINTTVTTPRRAQDWTNLRAERASSMLDHRQRLTFEMLYEPIYFRSRNWFLKNIAGNWEIAPVYSYQTGQLVTIQSGTDSNLNADSAGDRAIVNPGGNPSIGSATTALKNSAGDTVAYLVNNPAAGYIATPKGAIATGGRNTEHLNPIDNLDLALIKRFDVRERYGVEFSAHFGNIFNHPQYVGGFLNDVQPFNAAQGTSAGTMIRNFLTPGSSTFGDPTQVFSSNPRFLNLALKLNF